MQAKIKIFDDVISTSKAVAWEICKLVNQHMETGKMFNIALSGGSTPLHLFKVLADDFAELIPWKTVCLYWVDERCVPPTHAESNYGMTFNVLLNKGLIPSENIFRMRGEDLTSLEVDRYKKLLEENLENENGFPVFNLILLGMGDDGHTASIFPDKLELLLDENSVAHAIHPLSQQERITLTGKTISNAKEVFFLINGKSKSSILSQIIKSETGSENYPANFVMHNHNVTLFLDKDAARDL